MTAFDRFKDSLERGITSRADLESLDLAALRELDSVEREQARQLLAVRIGQGDPRIVDALAEIDSAASWADVERAFTQGSGFELVHAAMSLWMRQRDARVVPRLRSEVVGNLTAPSYLCEVLSALRRIEGPAADDAILEAMESPDLGAVGIACNVLFIRYGWDEYEHPGARLFTLRCGITSTFPSVHAEAMAELRALLARKHAGDTDAQLGIVATSLPGHSPALSAVLALAFDGLAAPVPDAATLAQLAGPERTWAIDLLLGRLQATDLRVLPALTQLNSPRIALALADHQAGRRIR